MKEIGRFAVCAHGIVGRVEKVNRTEGGRRVYIGRNLEGRAWETTTPRFIREQDVATLQHALKVGSDVR